MQKFKTMALKVLFEILSVGVAWVAGLMSVEIISAYFAEKGFSNLWGLWSDKWVVDHETFSILEWTIAAVLGFVIMQLVNKYWSPFVARAFKLENTA